MNGSQIAWSAAAAAAVAGALLTGPTAAAESPTTPLVPYTPTPAPAQLAPASPKPTPTSPAPNQSVPPQMPPSAAAVIPSSPAEAAALPRAAQAVNPAQGETISCTLETFPPYLSQTVNSVQSVSTVVCDGPAGISLGSELFVGALPVGVPGVDFGVTEAGAISSTLGCFNGTYVAGSIAAILFPPGFTPLTSPVIGVVTPPTPITCS